MLHLTSYSCEWTIREASEASMRQRRDLVRVVEVGDTKRFKLKNNAIGFVLAFIETGPELANLECFLYMTLFNRPVRHEAQHFMSERVGGAAIWNGEVKGADPDTASPFIESATRGVVLRKCLLKLPVTRIQGRKRCPRNDI